MLRHPRSPARPRPARPCWSGTVPRHGPGYLPGKSCHTGRRSDTQLLPSLSRATPSAVSEHGSELLGFPISRSLTTCCVYLEPRLLSSTGIAPVSTVLRASPSPQGARPLPHGRPVDHPHHAKGLPVLRALSLCTCCRHYPGAATGGEPRSSPQSYQPSPKWRSGRPAHRPFRGLPSVHITLRPVHLLDHLT